MPVPANLTPEDLNHLTRLAEAGRGARRLLLMCVSVTVVPVCALFLLIEVVLAFLGVYALLSGDLFFGPPSIDHSRDEMFGMLEPWVFNFIGILFTSCVLVIASLVIKAGLARFLRIFSVTYIPVALVIIIINVMDAFILSHDLSYAASLALAGAACVSLGGFVTLFCVFIIGGSK